ncbi:hypothetical protein BJX70DRAFT_397841 [Aspergillus crustosus]
MESLDSNPRPETDYERWLQNNNEDYQPGEKPIYEPTTFALDNTLGNNMQEGNKNPVSPSLSHDSFIHPAPKSMHPCEHLKASAIVICAFIVAIALMAVTRSFWKKRQEARRIVLPTVETREKR